MWFKNTLKKQLLQCVSQANRKMDNSIRINKFNRQTPAFRVGRNKSVLNFMLLLESPLSILILTTIPLWFLTIIVGDQLIADIAAIFGTVLMLSWIWTRIGRPNEMIRYVRLGAAALCAIQNSSWLTASFIHRFTLQKNIAITLRTEIGDGLSIEDYAVAIFYVTIFCAILAFLGSNKSLYRLEKKISYLLYRLQYSTTMNYMSWLLIFMVGFEFVLIVTGVIGQRTIVTEGYDEGTLPPWFVLYQSLLPGQIIFNALFLCLINKKGINKNKWYFFIFLLSFVTILFLFFNKGRSALVFSLIGHCYWYFFFTKKKPPIFKTILVLLIVYPLLSQALLFSNFIRSEDSGLDNYRGSAFEKMPIAFNLFLNSGKLRDAEKKRSADNLSTRPLVAHPLALCIAMPSERKSFTYGEEIINSLVWAIPGPLFPNKMEYPKQEALLYKHFPLNLKDTADSLYLCAYEEFGWFGLFIYPALLTLLWTIVLSLPRSFELSGLIIAILVSFFLEFFIFGVGEGAVISWLIGLRTFFFWLFMNASWRKLFPRKKDKILPVRAKLKQI